MHKIIRKPDGTIFGYNENGGFIVSDDGTKKFTVKGNRVIYERRVIGRLKEEKNKTIYYTNKQYNEMKKRKSLIRKTMLGVAGVTLFSTALIAICKYGSNRGGAELTPTPTITTIEMPDDDDEIKFSPTSVPTKKEEEKKPTQAPTRPENAIDVSFFVYTVKSGDTLEGITKRLYSTNILNAETENGRTEPEQNKYYDILYLVKNIARMNTKCNKMSSMNELMAGQQIILPDPDSITAETVDLICSVGATTFNVDFTNNIVVLVPTVVKQQSQGVSK